MKKLLEMLKNIFHSIFGKKDETEIVEPQSGATEPAVSEETPNTQEQNEVPEPAKPEPVEPEPVEPEKPAEEPKKEYKKIILLDNGHASTTPGKRSPKSDELPQLFEYELNRDIVWRISSKLMALGIKHEILVPEVENDISLTSRAARANKFCNKYGVENCIFLSIHANAAGNGSKWMNARGWCCYTSKGETASDPYAELFMREAEKVLVPLGMSVRKYSQKKYSWEENFTVLVKTQCPAILTESLFYDNKEDYAFLQTEEGRDAIAQLHVNAILKIENDEV